MEYKLIKENGRFFVKELKSEYKSNLRKRLFKFAVDTIRFLGTLPYNKEYDVFRYQLSKSGTSMGANYEEAQGAFSKKEFSSKIGICLKESKESNYFYRIIGELGLGDEAERKRLTQESDEFQKIFASILIKSRNLK